jgi:hypothetical protein
VLATHLLEFGQHQQNQILFEEPARKASPIYHNNDANKQNTKNGQRTF